MITLTPSTSVANTYSLNWSYQQNHVLEGLKSLVGQDDVLLTDVTLACDGEYIHAHKLVLSLCSSFFKDLFMKNKADKSNTIIILGNVSALNLRYLLHFIYQGKVDIPSKDVDSFLQAGKLLKIEGLIGSEPEQDIEQTTSNDQNNHTHQVPPQRPDASAHRPIARSQLAPSSSATSFKSSGTPTSVDSPSGPSKKPRLTEPSGVPERSSIPVESTPVVVGQAVTISEIPPEGDVGDPLDDSEHYEHEDLEGDMEEGIDFNHVKTEPIHVYAGFEGSHQSDMMHSESMGEDSYGGSVDDSYPIPQSHSASMVMASSSSMSQMQSQPGTSTSGRPRGNVPAVLNGQFFQIVEVTDNGVVRASCMVCFKRESKERFIKGRLKPSSNFITHLKKQHPSAYQEYMANRYSVRNGKLAFVSAQD